MPRDRKTYDRLCGIADKLLKKYNPCSGCVGCCTYPKPYDCCTGCPFNGPQGCITSCLACKLWLCGKASNYNNRSRALMGHQLLRLKNIAAKLNIHYARSTPEEALNIETVQNVWYFYYTLNRNKYAQTK